MECQNEQKVENIAVALIREYLSAKGFLATLFALEHEMLKYKANVSRPSQIISDLHLEKAFKEKKVFNVQYQTVLEVFIWHRLKKVSSVLFSSPLITHPCKTKEEQVQQLTSHSAKSIESVINSKLLTKANDCRKICAEIKSLRKKNKSFVHSEPDLVLHSENLNELSVLADLSDNSQSENYKHSKLVNLFSVSRERRRVRRLSSCEINSSQEILKEKCKFYGENKNSENEASMQNLECAKMDFNINEITTDAPSNMLSCILGEDRPITVDEACDLRLLLFGNTVDTFGTEWTEQSFHFRRRPLSYGLKQKKPGPCGVLAAVQAHVLYELLFSSAAVTLESGLLRPKAVERKEALARALTSILWQAGRKKEAVIAVRCNKIVFDSSVTSNILRADGMIEYLRLKYFRSRNCILEYFINFISELMNDDTGSCVLFLYSVILTHGIESIKEEMDYPESHLIGDDGYCSQEVVNLMLIGKAVPNLFDGNLELNSGGEKKSIHRGIPGQSAIGLLSLYEYQNTCAVGNHYKNPIYPIWVILGGSHFSVLFGSSTDILEKTSPDDSFRLFYYDGLSSQNEENSFIIRPFAKQVADAKDMTLPAVVRCIYTRWPHASIESENRDS